VDEQVQRYAAELIGTFALVFIGAGAVIANALTDGGLGILGIALAHGLVLLAMIYAVGNVSGAHINPAVTLAFVATRKLPLKTGIYYIIFQLIGASLAGLALLAAFPHVPAVINLGATDLAEGVSFSQGVLLEAVLTFFLVFVIFGVSVDRRGISELSGLAAGLTLAFGVLIGGAFTGGALNPARAFGPAIASQYFPIQHLVYWIGPILGALAAAVLYQYFFLEGRVKPSQPRKRKR